MNRPSVRRIEVGPIGTNCYIITCPVTGAVLLIDPGGDASRISGELERLDAVVYTHGHFDHCGGAAGLLEKFEAETMIHGADGPLLEIASAAGAEWGFQVSQPPRPRRELVDGDRVETGEMVFKVIHTPGHSPGSICLYGHGMLFSGDTLFRDSIGRTDLPGSSDRLMQSSLRRLMAMVEPDTAVYPGHGPATVMKRELEQNPFLG